jgi:hypothetical protein
MQLKDDKMKHIHDGISKSIRWAVVGLALLITALPTISSLSTSI